MPPSLPSVQLRAIPRFRCLTLFAQRTFSTSTSLSSTDGPENPNYIEVPTTRQPQAFPKVDIKGTLPPPRNLFPKRAGDKTSPEYFKRTTPPPKSNTKPANDYEAWKHQISENRRKNLQHGLKDLHQRKVRTEKKVAKRSERKQAERNALLNAPQREDERLTNPTVAEAVRALQSGPVPDPNREARLAAKAERVRAREVMRQEARQNALHTLYMNARSFITTEEQLNKKIEEIFVPELSVWEKEGPPKTVQELLSVVNKTSRTAIDFYKGPQDITGKRMKKIGEELTGGKMD